MCCARRLLPLFVCTATCPEIIAKNKKTPERKTKSFFILAAQLNAWHNYHKFQRYLFHEERLQVRFLKKQNTQPKEIWWQHMCLSQQHTSIHMSLLQRTILQNKRLISITWVQPNVTWEREKKKCIYKSNTKTGLGIIFNYYTKWFRVTAFLITVQQKALVASHKLTNISFQQHVIWPGCVICSNWFNSGYLQSRMVCRSGFIAIDVHHKKKNNFSLKFDFSERVKTIFFKFEKGLSVLHEQWQIENYSQRSTEGREV